MNNEQLAKELLDCFDNFNTERVLNRLKLSYKGENIILFLLMELGGSGTPGQLYERVDFSAARLSAIIKSLESKGYVEKNKNRKDKRSSIVEITGEGFMYFMSLRRQIVENAMTIIEKLGEDDVKQLLRIIGRLGEISNSMEER